MLKDDATVLVLGATGMLGHSLVSVLAQAGLSVVRHDRAGKADCSADLGDAAATHAVLDCVQPALIVNLAGLTNVDACEQHPEKAFVANVRSVENVAAWVHRAAQPTRLLHISTDQVYEGRGPHAESAASPRNYYAFSKYAGELAASAVGATVIRTNFVGRSHCTGRSSLSDWLYGVLQRGEAATIFEDVLFSPLSMQTLCGLLVKICRNPPPGIYNLGSREGCSKADFARAFAAALGLSAAQFKSQSVAAAAGLHAYRPRDMRMDSTRIADLLDLTLPALHEEILSLAEEYRHAG
jgi:dTDP-4-dehydrorhamnose reductase